MPVARIGIDAIRENMTMMTATWRGKGRVVSKDRGKRSNRPCRR